MTDASQYPPPELPSVPQQRPSRPPRNFLARREQRRLLFLVMALGMTLVLMNEAAKPARWVWIWGGQPPAEDSAGQREVAPIDTRLANVQDPVVDPGTFIAQPAVAKSAPADKPYFSGVRAELLADVRDDTVFVGGDHAGFFHLLDVLQRAETEDIVAASTGEVSFVQVFKQPAEYRGVLVTLRGSVRRATWRDAPRNESGIAGYYHTVLQPSAHRDNPVVIYCLQLPEGFPTGEKIRVDNVTLTGFFFKRWAYQAGDGIRTAPLLLARGLQWQPLTAQSEPPFTQTRGAAWMVGIGVSFGLVVATSLVIVSVRRGRARFVRTTAADRAGQAESVGDSLADITVGPEPHEMLRELQQQAESPATSKDEPRPN